mgnify:FL=1
MVKAVCERILHRAMALDMNAEVASVSRRDADDATLVRIRTSKDAALGVLAALRAAWPLATVSLVENCLNGNTEAQVLLPSKRDERNIAKTLANYGAGQKPLRVLANTLLVALGIACALSIAL